MYLDDKNVSKLKKYFGILIQLHMMLSLKEEKMVRKSLSMLEY